MKRKPAKPNTNQLLRVVGLLCAIYLMFFCAIKVFKTSSKSATRDTKVSRATIENLLHNSYPTKENFNAELQHRRCWNQLRTEKELCMQYSAQFKEAKTSTDFKNSLQQKFTPIATDYVTVWKTIYGSIYKRNPDALNNLVDSLSKLGLEKELNRTEFARAVVSFVQDMPYWFILGENDCKTNNDKSFPCIDQIEFGLLTPMEVAYTAIGDCDSKSLLLYSLLKTLGYNPMILISKQYRHAILALDIPSSGDYLNYKGSRYYYWETTATGWQSGMLPPSCDNKNYWKIALPPDFNPENTYKTL